MMVLARMLSPWGRAICQLSLTRVMASTSALHHRSPPLAQAADKALVQAVHIDIACAAIEKAVDQHLGIETGHQVLELRSIQALGLGRVNEGLCIGGIDQLFLFCGTDIQHAAWGEDGGLGKTGGRCIVEGAAGTGQGLHLGRTIVLFKQRGRAACGVIARLGFTLEHQHGRGVAPPLWASCQAVEAPAIPAPMMTKSQAGWPGCRVGWSWRYP